MIIVIKTLKLLHCFEFPLKIHDCSHKMSFQLQKPKMNQKYPPMHSWLVKYPLTVTSTS